MIQDYIKDCQLEGKNLVRYGTKRDTAIVRSIEEHEALSTQQIAALFFRTKTGMRKAQERLRLLLQKKRVEFTRYSIDEPNIYFIRRKRKQLDHLIGVNWAYVWFKNNLLSGQSIYYWKREIDCGNLVADGFIGIKNPGHEYIWYFVEYDRSNYSHNPFDKITKYNNFYRNHENMELWWKEKAKIFPKILIITENQGRKEAIEGLINNPTINKYGLKFIVRLAEDIKKEAMQI